MNNEAETELDVIERVLHKYEVPRRELIALEVSLALSQRRINHYEERIKFMQGAFNKNVMTPDEIRKIFNGR